MNDRDASLAVSTAAARQLLNDAAPAFGVETAFLADLLLQLLVRGPEKASPEHVFSVLGRKLLEDIEASQHLLSRAYAGPAQVLLRTCRENLTRMLHLALSDRETAQAHASYYCDLREQAHRLVAHKRASDALKQPNVSPDARSFLLQGVLPEKEAKELTKQVKQGKHIEQRHSFPRLATDVHHLLVSNGLNTAPNFLTIIAHYWTESIAVHSGYLSLVNYHPGPGSHPRHFHHESLLYAIVLLLELIDMFPLLRLAAVRIGNLDEELLGDLMSPELRVLRERVLQAIDLDAES